jgi:hypothetical protein
MAINLRNPDKQKLVAAIRKSAAIERQAERKEGLFLPEGTRTYRSWPLCLTCGREVEAVEMKNANSKGVEIWARCHGGAEDWQFIEWPARIDGDPLKDQRANDCIRTALLSAVMFDPHKILK